MDKGREFGVKMDRVAAWCRRSGLDGVVLSLTENVAWLGCGADSVVNSAAPTGVATLVAADGRCTLVTNNIEVQRLAEEEFAGVPLAGTEVFPWWEPHKRAELVLTLTAGRRFAADDGLGGLPPLASSWTELRYSLTDAEKDRYRALARDAARAVEEACCALRPGLTEAEMAGMTARACAERGIRPVVLLVACDERLRKWRHPVAKDTPLRRTGMVVVCGRRQGLIAALSRLVSVGEPDAELRRRHEAVCFVDATLIAATRPGRKAAEILDAGRRAYAARGFPDEWQRHHQGGATGYLAREYVAHPGSSAVVAEGQAFAWNPSITGTKSEDTILAGPEGGEVLTVGEGRFPRIEVEVGGRVLVRSGLLTIEA